MSRAIKILIFHAYRTYLLIALAVCTHFAAHAELPNLTRNDQYPIFSSVYPYSFLATRQKAQLMRFDYTYVPARFRISVSGYRQFANMARDSERNAINIGDINGRWNMLGLFYDPKMQATLFDALGLTLADVPPAPAPPDISCINLITDPKYVDPNQEFGFFTIPTLYRKYGVRFESEILLIDRCYYAVGLRAQWGLADVRQSVCEFDDLTCQALGISCPANPTGLAATANNQPSPATFTGITPPYTNPYSTTDAMPCPANSPQPLCGNNCVEPLQKFTPCASQQLCLSFGADCKQFVIQNIMKQTPLIARILGLDINNYHKVGVDDLRLLLFWRHIYIINEDDERYPRVLFMPFAEAGVGIPMERAQPTNKPFAVPIGNNNHTYVGGTAGYTIDFLDTIDVSFSGGFSYFFPHERCNVRLPTDEAESGIFPYTADIDVRPGPTWYFNVGMHAWHFLDLLSVWAEYCIVSHAQDKIHICRSFIPAGSKYEKTGFLVERAETLSKWEVHVVNVGFNYDLSDNFSWGAFFQIPIKQRNAYRQGTVMGTISFVY